MDKKKPKFVEGAGFYKAGAIIEDGVEYIRFTGHSIQFNVTITCKGEQFRKEGAGSGDETDDLTREDKAWLLATGRKEEDITEEPLKKELKASRYMAGFAFISDSKDFDNIFYEFSAFGSSNKFKKIRIVIEESDQSSLMIFHIGPSEEYRQSEGFSSVLELDGKTFEKVWRHVDDSRSRIHLSVDFMSPYFYAQWSPVDAGGLIKFLNHDGKNILENYTDLPSNFRWTGPMKLKFTLTLEIETDSSNDIREHESEKHPAHGENEDDMLITCCNDIEILRNQLLTYSAELDQNIKAVKCIKYFLMTCPFFEGHS